MFELDLVFHILRFYFKGINLSWGISHRISTLKVVHFDSNGYVEFDTNIGIECIDILDDDMSVSVKNTIKNYLASKKSLEVKIV